MCPRLIWIIPRAGYFSLEYNKWNRQRKCRITEQMRWWNNRLTSIRMPFIQMRHFLRQKILPRFSLHGNGFQDTWNSLKILIFFCFLYFDFQYIKFSCLTIKLQIKHGKIRTFYFAIWQYHDDDIKKCSFFAWQTFVHIYFHS